MITLAASYLSSSARSAGDAADIAASRKEAKYIIMGLTNSYIFQPIARSRKLGKREFFRVFNAAWDYGVTVDNVQGGFRGCGLVPYNPHSIPRHAYTPCSTTERSLPSVADNQQMCQETVPCDGRQSDNQSVRVAVERALCPVTTMPGNQPSTTASSGIGDDIVAAVGHISCSVMVQSGHQSSAAVLSDSSGCQLAPTEPVSSASGNQSTTLSFKDIMPFPKRDRTGTRKRKKPPSYELTSEDTLTFVRAAHCTTVNSQAKRHKTSS